MSTSRKRPLHGTIRKLKKKQNITFMSAEADSSGGKELRFLSLQLMKLPKFIQKKMYVFNNCYFLHVSTTPLIQP